MKNFLINITIVLTAVLMLVGTSALLEFDFFTKFIERRLLIVIIQIIEIWIFLRVIIEFNKPTETQQD